MLVDVVQESRPEFRTGSGVVGTDVARLGSASARQTVTLADVTAGSFKLGVGGVETAAIAFDSAAAAVQTALAAVVGAGNVAVSGDPGAWVVDFTGALRWQLIAAMTVVDVDLEGEGHAIAATVNERGHAVGWEVTKYVMLRANGANTSVIMIGHSAAEAGDGFILSASQQSPPIYVDNLNKLYVVGRAADQGYSWIAC
jgi:hypothetical protein